MLAQWRAAGFSRDQLEVWTVSMSSGGLDTFINDESESVFASYDAWTEPWDGSYPSKDDLFVVNREGLIVHSVNLQQASLYSSENQLQLDTWVRALLQ